MLTRFVTVGYNTCVSSTFATRRPTQLTGEVADVQLTLLQSTNPSSTLHCEVSALSQYLHATFFSASHSEFPLETHLAREVLLQQHDHSSSLPPPQVVRKNSFTRVYCTQFARFYLEHTLPLAPVRLMCPTFAPVSLRVLGPGTLHSIE